MQKERKSLTCRVTKTEKRLLTLLRVWEIGPVELARALDIVKKGRQLEKAILEEKVI